MRYRKTTDEELALILEEGDKQSLSSGFLKKALSNEKGANKIR